MMDLTQQIRNIDLAALVKDKGVKLSNGMGICPLPNHDDQHPSFKVSGDNRFTCYGCGEYGDAVDFIQKLHGLSFKEALQHLGIKRGPITAEIRCRISEAERKRKVKEKRELRISDLIQTLALLIRATHRSMTRLTPENFDEQCIILDPLSWWEYCHDMLIRGTENEKQQCFEALKDMPIKKRDRIFNADFDFSGWLRKFIIKWNSPIHKPTA